MGSLGARAKVEDANVLVVAVSLLDYAWDDSLGANRACCPRRRGSLAPGLVVEVWRWRLVIAVFGQVGDTGALPRA